MVWHKGERVVRKGREREIRKHGKEKKEKRRKEERKRTEKAYKREQRYRVKCATNKWRGVSLFYSSLFLRSIYREMHTL